jgi:MoaA/NifB/PqqE/SkfB family radical SAM enzyme
MKLEDIGFYTLSENRAKSVNRNTPIMRAEILLTDRCNLKCPYCRGMKNRGDLFLPYVQDTLSSFFKYGLVNVRFSGGEPTLYPQLKELVSGCVSSGVKRIALSTNGTANLKLYKDLIKAGVNDFSISLDSGCCATGEKMTGGIKESWNKAVETIKYVSKYSYTTCGVVFNELNYSEADKTIKFIDSLGVSDIRIIPSAQYNKALKNLASLPVPIRNKYPILNYRITNLLKNRNFRGIKKSDCHKCYLTLDDVAVSGNYQYPCIIYLREYGSPISTMGENFREKRVEWFKQHNTYEDNICRNNCLDVCVDYNNRVDYYARKNARNIV